MKRVLPIVDRTYIFDNSRDNQAARRWVRTRDGQIAKIADGKMPDWIEEAVTAPPPLKDDGLGRQ